MYVRLLQGYDMMNVELQKASAYAAKQLRLMVFELIAKFDILIPVNLSTIMATCKDDLILMLV